MNQTEKTTLEIPADVVVDIAKIILKSGLEHRIMDCDEEKYTLRMEILFPENKQQAKENINQIIDDYNFFRYGE